MLRNACLRNACFFETITTRANEKARALRFLAFSCLPNLFFPGPFRKPLLTYFGLGLLVGATGWGLWWPMRIVEPIWATVLAFEALAMALAAVLLDRLSDHEPGATCSASRQASDRNRLIDAYRIPLLHVAEIVAPMALAVGGWMAWVDLGVVCRTPTPVVTAVYAGAFYLLMAWGYRSVERTWVGSMVALAGLVHTLVFNYTGLLDQPWLDALLAHATLAVLASVFLGAWAQRPLAERFADDIRRVFIKPLGQTALLSSSLAIPVLATVSWHETLSLAACLFWLAGVWLVIAWTNRWPAMLAAAQAVLTLAVAVATTAWLQRHPWDFAAKVDLLDPRSLQAYGIGLGLLTLAWTVTRILLRRNTVAQHVLNPEWPTVDRVVGHAVVGLQLLLAAAYLVPGCWQELTPVRAGRAAAGSQLEAFGPTAWILVGVLASSLVVALWHRWRKDELASSLLVAATVPCLVAGQFAGEQATASALRWGLGIGLAVCSAAFWQRRQFERWSRHAGAMIAVGANGPRTGRAVLLATTVGPVLALTVLATLLRLARTTPGGPALGSFFFEVGPELSYLVPLVLVIACLVGFALREASAGYAFSAGLVANMSVTLGYLLSVVKNGKAIGTDELVAVVQLVTIAAAVWAIAWMIGRRWVDVWREAPAPDSARVLMNVPRRFGSPRPGCWPSFSASRRPSCTSCPRTCFGPPRRLPWPVRPGRRCRSGGAGKAGPLPRHRA